MSTDQEIAGREVEVVWVTLWCEVCDDEWDTFMTPEQASGDSDPDPELVTCPVCGQDGEWAGADGPDDGPLL